MEPTGSSRYGNPDICVATSRNRLRSSNRSAVFRTTDMPGRPIGAPAARGQPDTVNNEGQEVSR